MKKNQLEAAIVYVNSEAESADILADLSSFSLFLNTNDFFPMQIDESDLEKILQKKKLLSLSKAKSTITHTQKQILDRYISLYAQVQTLPSLDEEIDTFESDLNILQKNAAVITQASSESKNTKDFYDAAIGTSKDYQVSVQKQEAFLTKQEQLFEKEQQLELKEAILNKSILKEDDPRIQNFLSTVNQKIAHLEELRSQHNECESNLQRAQFQYEQRQQQFEKSISKLTQLESHLHTKVLEKQKELDAMSSTVMAKSVELRQKEKTLLQTNKRIHQLGHSFQKREQNLVAGESEYKKNHARLESDWEKLRDHKHEVIAKQHQVAKKEIALEGIYAKKERELAQRFKKRMHDLEKEYKQKLLSVKTELDSISVKKAHLKEQEKEIETQKKLTDKQTEQVSFLRKKYELQLKNQLDETKSIRNEVIAHKHAPKSHVHHSDAKTLANESLLTILALLDVAESEISLSPDLAKRTYKRIQHIYNHLSFSEQSQIHGKIISVHAKIAAAASTKSGEDKK